MGYQWFDTLRSVTLRALCLLKTCDMNRGDSVLGDLACIGVTLEKKDAK